jgi:hypothetical protein
MSSNLSPRVPIGEVIRNAVLFNPENPQDLLKNSDVLVETVSCFFCTMFIAQHTNFRAALQRSAMCLGHVQVYMPLLPERDVLG